MLLLREVEMKIDWEITTDLTRYFVVCFTRGFLYGLGFVAIVKVLHVVEGLWK